MSRHGHDFLLTWLLSNRVGPAAVAAPRDLRPADLKQKTDKAEIYKTLPKEDKSDTPGITETLLFWASNAIYHHPRNNAAEHTSRPVSEPAVSEMIQSTLSLQPTWNIF